MPESALDQLVRTLIQGTQSGTVKWQEATGDGNSFVTRRRVGTITIQRRGGLSAVAAGAIVLSVRDQVGEVITEIQSPTATSAMTGSPTSNAARQLLELFEAVRAKHLGQHAALEQFIAEFQKP
jgi:hypothetical protein